MPTVYGHLAGLKAAQIKKLEHFYRRRIPPERVLTPELIRPLCELARELNRQLGLLVNRRGEVVLVILGVHNAVTLPSLDDFRSASTRFKGLRLIHTHLQGEPLSREDLTDMALLRLDLVCAVETGPEGLPGKVHWAHLVPENPEGTYWMVQKPQHPSEFTFPFLSFIQSLEGEFTGKQKTRAVEAPDRAILVRVETTAADAEDSLAELGELARSSGVSVFDSVRQRRPERDPRFLLGRGKLAELIMHAQQIGANTLIFDHELTPTQVRTLSEMTEMRVIDRTQVILDIFAQRARSREGKIQVELAQLRYLLPRLVGKVPALSRLAGGIGSRGPGETKLEIDRRRARDRIHRLEDQLEAIEKSRRQRRGRRERSGIPVVSIVGYTNAGKSTLLNSLTKSRVLAEDRLFATLDPKSARLRFPREREALVTDTVGFIRDLPEELLTAFRATLDELQDADILLHVIDVSHARFEDQIDAVEKLLEELGLADKPILRVFNKEDRFPDKTRLTFLCRRFGAIALSALHPDTFPPLLERLETLIAPDAGAAGHDPETSAANSEP